MATMGWKGMRHYARVIASHSQFEDAEDYEPGQPLALLLESSSPEIRKLRRIIRAGDYPQALRYGASLRERGLKSRELEVQCSVAWSLLNWLPVSDNLRSIGPSDHAANLVLARQSIAMGLKTEAVHYTGLLAEGAPPLFHVRMLSDLAGSISSERSDLARIIGQIEDSDDISLHYYLALVEIRHDVDRGLERLEFCLKSRPKVPAYSARLMSEYLRVDQIERAYQVYTDYLEFIETFYVPWRTAIACYACLFDRESAMDEFRAKLLDTPEDRIIAEYLMHRLKEKHEYFKVASVWWRWYIPFLRAWPKPTA